MKMDGTIKRKLTLMRLFWAVGAFLMVAMPSVASAHDALGGDELAVANWMLIGALAASAVGGIMGVWAFRSGQLNNIEESKFTMIDSSEDFDAIMAESDAREATRAQAEVEAAKLARPGKAGTKAANTTAAGAEAKPTHI